jgi:hypothetical protein
MKVKDEQLEVPTNEFEIVESFVKHNPIDEWVNQFTEDELELMQEHLSYSDSLECYNAIQSRLYEYRSQRGLERLKQVKWSDVATMIHPNGKSIILISRDERKNIGELFTFNGAEYHLRIDKNILNLD